MEVPVCVQFGTVEELVSVVLSSYDNLIQSVQKTYKYIHPHARFVVVHPNGGVVASSSFASILTLSGSKLRIEQEVPPTKCRDFHRYYSSYDLSRYEAVALSQNRPYRYQIAAQILQVNEDGPKQVVVVSGMRRVGKTTTIHQALLLLMKTGQLKAEEIGFVDCATVLSEAFDNMPFLLSMVILQGMKVLVLDEVFYIPDWQSCVRNLSQQYPSVTFIVSGSRMDLLGTTELNQRVTEYNPLIRTGILGGRTITIDIKPMTFGEFCFIDAKEPTFPTPQELSVLLEHYLKWGGIPMICIKVKRHLQNLDAIEPELYLILENIYKSLLQDAAQVYYKRKEKQDPEKALQTVKEYAAFCLRNHGNSIVIRKKSTGYGTQLARRYQRLRDIGLFYDIVDYTTGQGSSRVFCCDPGIVHVVLRSEGVIAPAKEKLLLGVLYANLLVVYPGKQLCLYGSSTIGVNGFALFSLQGKEVTEALKKWNKHAICTPTPTIIYIFTTLADNYSKLSYCAFLPNWLLQSVTNVPSVELRINLARFAKDVNDFDKALENYQKQLNTPPSDEQKEKEPIESLLQLAKIASANQLYCAVRQGDLAFMEDFKVAAPAIYQELEGVALAPELQQAFKYTSSLPQEGNENPHT